MSENSITTVDFEVTQERTLETIATEIIMIDSHVKKTVIEGAIEIGRRLYEAKEKVGHGNFESWCEETLDYSYRKARNFMTLADNYGNESSPFSKLQTSADLSISKALSLLALPDEEVETFAEEHDVEDMSVRELEKEIKRVNEEKEALQQINKQMAEEVDLTNRSLEAMGEKMKNAVSRADYDIEVADLKNKISDAEEKAEKAKQKIQKLKEEHQAAINNAVSEAKESMYEQAKAEAQEEYNKAVQENAILQEQVAKLEKKLEKSNSMSEFKVNADMFQEAFNKCCEAMGEADSVTAESMKFALKTVLEGCLKRLQGED